MKKFYLSDDELGDEFCKSEKCRLCFGVDESGESEGHGCPKREQFISDHEDLIVDFEKAYFIVQEELDLLKKSLGSEFIKIQNILNK